MVIDHFASPKHRLARAKNKLRTLEKRGRTYINKKPYAFVADSNPDGLTETYKFKITKPLPLGVRDLAWEIIEDSRSALDQAGYASAIASGKPSPKNTSFPIADSAAQLETDVIGRGRCKDIPPNVLDLFRSFQPYNGGNHAIWALNKLCNGNKHRLVIPTGAVAENQVRGMMTGLAASGVVIFHPPVWDSTKNEMALARMPIGHELKYDLQFAMFIAFGEVEPVRGEPVIPVLDTITREVERVLMATEAECNRAFP